MPAAVGEPSVWDELHFSSDPADYSNRQLGEIDRAASEEFISLVFGGGPEYEWTPDDIARANRLQIPECRRPAAELQFGRQLILDYIASETDYYQGWSEELSVERIADDLAWIWRLIYSDEEPPYNGATLVVFTDGRWRYANCEQGLAAYAPGPPPLPLPYFTIGQPFKLYDSDGETPYELTLLGPPEGDGDMLIIPARIGALFNLFDPYYRSFVGELVMEPAAGGPAQRLFDYPVDTGCPGSIFGQTDVQIGRAHV